MTKDVLERARDLVMLEGWLLDTRDWDAWLDLYAPDATYWVPSWLDEDTYVSDPMKEISLIYHANRGGLEDRIFRIRTGRSLSCEPMPRTCHLTSVIRAEMQDDGTIRVDSNWTVHSYRLQKATYHFGQQTHVVAVEGDLLRFRSRKVIVANDIIHNQMDIYSI